MSFVITGIIATNKADFFLKLKNVQSHCKYFFKQNSLFNEIKYITEPVLMTRYLIFVTKVHFLLIVFFILIFSRLIACLITLHFT